MSSNPEILLEPGDFLYREGDPPSCAFLLESGEITLFSELTGSRIDCERRGPGSIVGELSILTGQPRAVSVEATTACRLYRISAEQILTRFERLDPVLRACIETSISFTATFANRMSQQGGDAQFAPATLRNARKLIDQFKFEADIYRGLADDQFHMVYQPIVEIGDTRVVGVEALMRWDHPERGPVAPTRFVATAEAMGSVRDLTKFALWEACGALARIRRAAPAPKGFYAAVNISGQDVVQDDFVDFVAHVVDRNELPAGAIRLEITESDLISDPAAAARNLERLRTQGCAVSIDDFGTGYSNLAYLKTLPLSAIKIDRAFAADAKSNGVSRSIVRMLLGLGQEMGVDIIAEGLECLEDVEMLRSLGCTYAQGYVFHKPMRELEIVRLMAVQARGAAGRGAA